MGPLPRLMPAACVAIAVLLGWLVFAFVDLTPHVDQRFFFAPDSEVQRENRELARKFHNQQLLAVTAHAPDIRSEAYRERIDRLTRRLDAVPDVLNVTSLTRGPDDLEEALTGPMWRRLLLLEGVSATNLVLTADAGDTSRLVGAVMEVLREAERPDFQLSLAGVPYVIDSIGQNLRADFRNFSAAAIVVFGVLMLGLFRSWAVLLGSLVACIAAALGTLLVQQLLGGRIGLLTVSKLALRLLTTQ